MNDDGFTKEAQDAYFYEGRCPYCRSEEIRVGCGWDDYDFPVTSYRPAGCEGCFEEWIEVWYRDGGSKFLLRSLEELEEMEGEDDVDNEDEEDEDADDAEGQPFTSGVCNMDRESIINSLVDKRREQLDELDNVELLGETLAKAREEAIEERLVSLRDDLKYGADDDELLGEDGVAEMRWEAIEAQAESFTAELESMTDEELSALMGARHT